MPCPTYACYMVHVILQVKPPVVFHIGDSHMKESGMFLLQVYIEPAPNETRKAIVNATSELLHYCMYLVRNASLLVLLH